MATVTVAVTKMAVMTNDGKIMWFGSDTFGIKRGRGAVAGAGARAEMKLGGGRWSTPRQLPSASGNNGTGRDGAACLFSPHGLALRSTRSGTPFEVGIERGRNAGTLAGLHNAAQSQG